MDNNEYETIARSNESIRDGMDGKIDEPKLTQSSENNSCNCGNKCNGAHNCSCEQSMG